MAKGTTAPLGMTCALLTARTGTGGTATACPSPTDWQRGELAAYQVAGGGGRGNWGAVFHDRGGTMNCWSRAATARIVS